MTKIDEIMKKHGKNDGHDNKRMDFAKDMAGKIDKNVEDVFINLISLENRGIIQLVDSDDLDQLFERSPDSGYRPLELGYSDLIGLIYVSQTGSDFGLRSVTENVEVLGEDFFAYELVEGTKASKKVHPKSQFVLNRMGESRRFRFYLTRPQHEAITLLSVANNNLDIQINIDNLKPNSVIT